MGGDWRRKLEVRRKRSEVGGNSGEKVYWAVRLQAGSPGTGRWGRSASWIRTSCGGTGATATATACRPHAASAENRCPSRFTKVILGPAPGRCCSRKRMRRRHVYTCGLFCLFVLVCAGIIVGRIGSTFHSALGPRPPFKHRVTTDHGPYWRPDSVVDLHGRRLVYDVELNLVFLIVGDPWHGRITIAGTRDRLVLGSRQGVTHEFAGVSNALFIGAPNGDVQRLPLTPGVAKRVADRCQVRGSVDDASAVLREECASGDSPEGAAILEAIRRVGSERADSQPGSETSIVP